MFKLANINVFENLQNQTGCSKGTISNIAVFNNATVFNKRPITLYTNLVDDLMEIDRRFDAGPGPLTKQEDNIIRTKIAMVGDMSIAEHLLDRYEYTIGLVDNYVADPSFT